MRALANCLLRLSFVALAGFVLSTTAAAQTGLAIVTGIVSDESGGAVPGLTVTATNLATDIDYTGVTNEAGNYIITGVPIGAYVVAAELQGFKGAQSKVTLSAAQTARVDFKLTDLRHVGNTTEFWVPGFTTAAIIDLDAVSDPSVLESAYLAKELELNPDPEIEEWRAAPRVVANRDKAGQSIGGPPTEVRSRWTKENLYLLFICPYDELNLKPDPTSSAETPRLWDWDVAEAFIGWDYEHIGRYKEFQVSPQSEWVDLDIDRENPKGQAGMKWNSGYAVKGRIDAQTKVWYGMMRVPFSAIDPRPPQPGRELRIGLFRIAGADPRKQHYAWRPTGGVTFHVPEAFGILRLR